MILNHAERPRWICWSHTCESEVLQKRLRHGLCSDAEALPQSEISAMFVYIVYMVDIGRATTPSCMVCNSGQI